MCAGFANVRIAAGLQEDYFCSTILLICVVGGTPALFEAQGIKAAQHVHCAVADMFARRCIRGHYEAMRVNKNVDEPVGIQLDLELRPWR